MAAFACWPCVAVLAISLLVTGAPTGSSGGDRVRVLGTTVLFTRGQGFPCYRQPAVVAGSADASVVLAFAEGRNVSASACAPPLAAGLDAAKAPPRARTPPAGNEVGSLLLRRSTDAGQTFGPPTVILSGNLDFYVAVLDTAVSPSKLFLLVQQQGSVQELTSVNGGVTWQGPTPFSVPIPAPFTGHLQPAVGHGLQLAGDLCAGGPCEQAGRLLLPFCCTNGSAHGDKGHIPADHSCLFFSDDHGRSWSFGAHGQPGSRESQAVQLASNSSQAAVYLSERNFGSTPGHRLFTVSLDGGRTAAASGSTAIPTPVTAHWTGIVGGVLRLGGASAGSRIVFSAPDNPKVRGDLVLWASTDEARSWTRAGTIDAGLAGYSDLVDLSPSQPSPGPSRGAAGTCLMGVVYENGQATFADAISFARLQC